MFTLDDIAVSIAKNKIFNAIQKFAFSISDAVAQMVKLPQGKLAKILMAPISPSPARASLHQTAGNTGIGQFMQLPRSATIWDTSDFLPLVTDNPAWRGIRSQCLGTVCMLLRQMAYHLVFLRFCSEQTTDKFCSWQITRPWSILSIKGPVGTPRLWF